jgi:hypothetical protein
MRRAKFILPVCLFVVSACVAIVVTASRPDTVAYHLKRAERLRYGDVLKGAPKKALDYLQPKTWQWYRAGRPTEESLVRELEKHLLALIRLGYFERRVFQLQKRPLDVQFWNAYTTVLSNSPLKDQRWFAQRGFVHGYQQRHFILMTGSPSDIPVFERSLSQMDTNVTK